MLTRKRIGLLVACFLCAGCSSNHSTSAPSVDAPKPILLEQSSSGLPTRVIERSDSSLVDIVHEQLKNMTLEEKLGEMMIAGMEGTTANAATKKMIKEQHVGGVIFYKNNVSTPQGLASYVNQLKAWNQGNAAPLFISVDEEGGRVSRLPGLYKFPNAVDIGAKDNLEYAQQMGQYLGEASQVLGMNVDYAPVLDINSNPDNPVIGVRSYGAKPDIVSRMGIAVMKGIQSKGTISVVKHFPGHGDTAVDSHLALPVVSKTLAQLKSFEWLPFEEAIHQGADAVMVAHILFPKIDNKYPASLSKTIMTDQLRRTLRFKGVIITDDLTMGAIAENYGIGEAAVKAVASGADMVMVAHGYDNVDVVFQMLRNSVKNGQISPKRIDESVTRILTLKQKYNLADSTLVKAPNLNELNKKIRNAVSIHQ
ncbi:beta-N-acetylhexosaminidase [Paenibacillus shirakamiensis]|uniref:beta-N-acetylhexosaminidase n=1 Tax=Paenibacillus shirakamiensis TaxID=1265935 RepID=A0ABS4JF05_9BACL|nr:beta-N-acetylhexosaminidase [Paenibacillus shirakamiensis]MBP2000278.1 beta-N-acetylhexosaminidase [Paenibacillus shirakamiensis]